MKSKWMNFGLLSWFIFCGSMQAQSDSAETNSGEPFKDPFADQAPLETPDPSMLPFEPDPILEAPLPSGDVPIFRPEIPNSEPSLQPQVSPVVSPMPSAPTPVATPLPSPSPSEQPRVFEFPEQEDVKGPSSVDYVTARRFEDEKKVKTWNINPSFGAGFNLNRRYNQIHIEFSGGYRWKEGWELGGGFYYRTVKDDLIGFLGTVKRSFLLKNTRELRIEALPGASLGWALRKAPSGTKFAEGRMPFRLGSDFNFYPMPRFAVTTLVALEMFLFAIDTNGEGTNFFSKGLPTQAVLTVGTRWEF